ncbi:MAG: hypothetical protein R3D63_12395 [Paracoccaceae bacterium]
MCARVNEDQVETETVRLANGSWIRLVDRWSRDGDMVSLVFDITEQDAHLGRDRGLARRLCPYSTGRNVS